MNDRHIDLKEFYSLYFTTFRMLNRLALYYSGDNFWRGAINTQY